MTAKVCLTIEASGGGVLEAAQTERLRAALEAARPASLIILPAAGAKLAPAALRPVIVMAQKLGAAVLIAGDAALAKSSGADGVHLPASADIQDDYASARKLLGPAMIVGADAGHSRHDAMCLGEAGADYIAFGCTPSAGTDDPRASQLELCAWWADVFEVPVVALDATTLDDAQQLAATGADFVALAVPEGQSAAAVRDWALGMAAALDALSTPA